METKIWKKKSIHISNWVKRILIFTSSLTVPSVIPPFGRETLYQRFLIMALLIFEARSFFVLGSVLCIAGVLAASLALPTGLYPDAISTPPQLWQPKMTLDIAKSPLAENDGEKSLQVENYCSIVANLILFRTHINSKSNEGNGEICNFFKWPF